MEDNFLAIKIKEGDEKSLEILFRRYYAPLCNHALRIVKDQHSAEDAVQDVFFKLWENRDKLIITTSVKSFLYTSVRNHCLNMIKNSRHKVLAGASDTSDLYLPDTVEEDLGAYLEMENRLRLAMEKLPEKCREVFRLSREEGLSYSQIAEATGTSIKTVENHMGKALKSMRATLLSLMLQVF